MVYLFSTELVPIIAELIRNPRAHLGTVGSLRCALACPRPKAHKWSPMPTKISLSSDCPFGVCTYVSVRYSHYAFAS